MKPTLKIILLVILGIVVVLGLLEFSAGTEVVDIESGQQVNEVISESDWRDKATTEELLEGLVDEEFGLEPAVGKEVLERGEVETEIMAVEDAPVMIALKETDILENQLQEKLDQIIEKSKTPGASVYILSNGKQYSLASGFSSLEKKQKTKTSDTFRIASMSKTFVAAMTLQQAEAGLIDLDASISKYLPEYVLEGLPNVDIITVRNLLAMDSGLPDYSQSDASFEETENNPSRQWAADEAIELIYGEPANFLPSEDWEYSNTNYVLLEIILEQVTGKNISENLYTKISQPLGLKSVFLDQKHDKTGRVLTVRGHDRGDDVTDFNDMKGLGDGGVISDAQDVGEFLTALLGGQKIISTASLGEMSDFHASEMYGLGLEKTQTRFGAAWGHNGSSSGFSGEMLYFPKSGDVFVILTNDVDSDILENSIDSLLSVVVEN
jgi:D-alanyl-D-alanine carboxypeptidase